VSLFAEGSAPAKKVEKHCCMF